MLRCKSGHFRRRVIVRNWPKADRLLSGAKLAKAAIRLAKLGLAVAAGPKQTSSRGLTKPPGSSDYPDGSEVSLELPYQDSKR